VISVKKINEKNFEILIKPNSSLNGWQRFFFLSSIFILCGGIAINFKWSEQKELVTLSLDHVVVEKGRKQKEYTWREFRTFTAFEINKIKKDEINLGFKSKGQAVLVGDFLNADDKQELQYEISKIINHLNELNPSL
jgi:uncharacterized membrane protein